MNFFYEIKNVSYRGCHLIFFGLIIIILLIILFVINLNNNTINAYDNFNNIQNNKLILYYTTQNNDYHNIITIWNNFKKTYPHVITETIDCSTSKCKINKLPTIIYFKNNTPILYNRKLSVNNLHQFINNKTNKINNNKINNKKLVLYHTNWCGHCKNFLPIWKQFVNNNPKIKTEDIECSDNKNKNKCANIEGFPTIILFNDEKQIQYDGERTIDGLMDFFNKN